MWWRVVGHRTGCPPFSFTGHDFKGGWSMVRGRAARWPSGKGVEFIRPVVRNPHKYMGVIPQRIIKPLAIVVFIKPLGPSP